MTGLFFYPSRTMTAADAADLVGGELHPAHLANKTIQTFASLENPKPGSIVFSDGNARAELIRQLADCILVCSTSEVAFAGPTVTTIAVSKPQQAFVSITQKVIPESVKPSNYTGANGIGPTAIIDPAARLEANVTVEPGAVIGANAQIGQGTLIGANAVIGAGVCIGRDCTIGPAASITHALIGNRVIIHAGARIGQDGFGFIAGKAGLEKVPQIGRVIIQDSVEIGANTTIDRGALDDTVIGEGTKIDNLVQIAHNCRIGRFCVIAGHCGLSGSVTLGDGVMLGGRVGVADHVTIAARSQVAAASAVMNDIGEGQRWAGLPAQPIKEFFRELAIVRSLAREKRSKRDDQRD